MDQVTISDAVNSLDESIELFSENAFSDRVKREWKYANTDMRDVPRQRHLDKTNDRIVYLKKELARANDAVEKAKAHAKEIGDELKSCEADYKKTYDQNFRDYNKEAKQRRADIKTGSNAKPKPSKPDSVDPNEERERRKLQKSKERAAQKTPDGQKDSKPTSQKPEPQKPAPSKPEPQKPASSIIKKYLS